MPFHDHFRDLSLLELQSQCAQETKSYYQQLVKEAWHCFEIFRRAIVDKNQDAWAVLVEQYWALLERWVQKKAALMPLLEEEAFFVNRAFEKFWARNFSAREFEKFPDIRSVLKYLKLCVMAVVIDFQRIQGRYDAESLDENPHLAQVLEGGATTEEILEQLGGVEFWYFVRGRLSDEVEFYVLHDSFVYGLKPSEIFELHSGMFQDVHQVYRLKERVINRLRQDAELLAYLAEQVGKV